MDKFWLAVGSQTEDPDHDGFDWLKPEDNEATS